MEKELSRRGNDQQKEDLEVRMRARKGMLEGIPKGQEAGMRLQKAFSAILTGLHLAWKTMERTPARKDATYYFKTE